MRDWHIHRGVLNSISGLIFRRPGPPFVEEGKFNKRFEDGSHSDLGLSSREATLFSAAHLHPSSTTSALRKALKYSIRSLHTTGAAAAAADVSLYTVAMISQATRPEKTGSPSVLSVSVLSPLQHLTDGGVGMVFNGGMLQQE